jgi:hypothetical protein
LTLFRAILDQTRQVFSWNCPNIPAIRQTGRTSQ